MYWYPVGVIVVLLAVAPEKMIWNPSSVVALAVPTSFWIAPLEIVAPLTVAPK